MRMLRPAIALDPRLFGKGAPRLLEEIETPSPAILADIKLFASTFAIGFLFVSVLIF
jgi:hypothetical protein